MLDGLVYRDTDSGHGKRLHLYKLGSGGGMHVSSISISKRRVLQAHKGSLISMSSFTFVINDLLTFFVYLRSLI
jgi:hypothetical protein